jgi:hypothetical protein
LGKMCDRTCNTKVNDFDFHLLGVYQENIFELQVSVNEVVLVTILHSLDNLSEKGLSFDLV